MEGFIDTHIHLDCKEFDDDRDQAISRAREAGAKAMFVPAIDLNTSVASLELSERYEGFVFAMAGLHPEEVGPDYEAQLESIKEIIDSERGRLIGIGEVGLDFYWTRDNEREQFRAFERQVEWSVATGLPLMIHCRKAQNEMVGIMRRYEKELRGGVFHCFTGNFIEASQLLDFQGFFLGIGGVLTFKKSHLPEVVKDIPLERIVLETDAPYMAPVPMRGKRNESSFIPYIVERLAEAYGTSADEICRQTTDNALKVFPKARPI